MTVYLVRHAKAGDRLQWTRPDELRPLSSTGQQQAVGLLDLFHDTHLERILSSPAVRCLETMAPLAGARGLPIEPVEALGEGNDLGEVLILVRKHLDHGAVFCSHGDIIPALVNHYVKEGARLVGQARCAKGSTWTLDGDACGEVTSVRYLPPPETL